MVKVQLDGDPVTRSRIGCLVGNPLVWKRSKYRDHANDGGRLSENNGPVIGRHQSRTRSFVLPFMIGGIVA